MWPESSFPALASCSGGYWVILGRMFTIVPSCFFFAPAGIGGSWSHMDSFPSLACGIHRSRPDSQKCSGSTVGTGWHRGCSTGPGQLHC